MWFQVLDFKQERLSIRESKRRFLKLSIINPTTDRNKQQKHVYTAKKPCRTVADRPSTVPDIPVSQENPRPENPPPPAKFPRKFAAPGHISW
jgi:hypothetical protein